jgi:hypothetical protein
MTVTYAMMDSMTTTYVTPDMPPMLHLARFYHVPTGVSSSAAMVLAASLVPFVLFVNKLPSARQFRPCLRFYTPIDHP